MHYLFIFFNLFMAPVENNKSTLTFSVNNIKEIKGTLEIGLFNSNERFLEEGQAFRIISIAVKKSSETIIIKDLPKGTYAISLYQDINEDDICNLNFIGIPKEPYAFSNNFKPKFSAPTFEDCNFQLDTDKSLKIDLIN